MKKLTIAVSENNVNSAYQYSIPENFNAGKNAFLVTIDGLKVNLGIVKHVEIETPVKKTEILNPLEFALGKNSPCNCNGKCKGKKKVKA